MNDDLDSEFQNWIASDEKRVETRLVALVSLFVEVGAEDPESGDASEIIECETLDLSANGIQANAPIPLPQGALLPIIVKIQEAKFHLTAEIKWAREASNDAGEKVWSTGFLLLESDNCDLLAWKEAIVDWLED